MEAVGAELLALLEKIIRTYMAVPEHYALLCGIVDYSTLMRSRPLTRRLI